MLALVTLPSTVERSPVAFYRFVYRISRTKHRLGARLGCQRQVPFKRSNCSSPTHGLVYEGDFLESQSKENAENARTTYFFFELSIDRSIHRSPLSGSSISFYVFLFNSEGLLLLFIYLYCDRNESIEKKVIYILRYKYFLNYFYKYFSM